MSKPVFMDPDEIFQLLEGAEDTLTDEVRKTEQFFEQVSCPQCGDDVQPIVDMKRPFKTGMNTPNYMARCVDCACEFSPYTSIISKRGDPQRTSDDATMADFLG